MKNLPANHSVDTLLAHVRGRVQGVGFRAATVRRAHQSGLGGWVRNTDQGSVEVLLQGPHDAVDRMLSWLLQGPPGSRVDEVESEEIQTDRHYDRFEQI